MSKLLDTATELVSEVVSDPVSDLRLQWAFELANTLTVAQLECGVPIPPDEVRIEVLKTIMGWMDVHGQQATGKVN